MQDFRHLPDMLAKNRRDDRFIEFIHGERDVERWTFAELERRARGICGALRRRGIEPGAELVIHTRSNESFLTAFWAAILGGVVPVPVAVGATDEHRAKLARILGQLRDPYLYTDLDIAERLDERAGGASDGQAARRIAARTIVAEQLTPDPEAAVICDPALTDLAFVQYSSGSTSDPKGVLLTHGNLHSNIRGIVRGLGWTEDDVSLSWMPLTHDMGLIVLHLAALAAGMSHAIIDTDVFVRRPLLWLQKASELGATQLCSPNFGYRHCLKLVERKGLPAEVDLSRVRHVLNGAEPISAPICRQFLDAMAPHGLRPETMLPVYGLAEGTVGVSISALDAPFSTVSVDRHRLGIGTPVAYVEAGSPDAVEFVVVGQAIDDCAIRIADDADRVLADDVIGHIQLSGGNVTRGFYAAPEGSPETFTSDGWLRTGDCGFMHDGSLVITGRAKDIVIVNGQNYFAHDLEDIVLRATGLELGKVVVAAGRRADDQSEQPLVFVLYRKGSEEFRELAAAVRHAVAAALGIEIDAVVPVSRIPKTTSGKVQRQLLAAEFGDGLYDDVADWPERSEASAGATLEDEVLAICASHAGGIEIGLDDNLFEVGISSLNLTEIVLSIDQRYPGKIEIDDLFDHPTPRAVAGRLAVLI